MEENEREIKGPNMERREGEISSDRRETRGLGCVKGPRRRARMGNGNMGEHYTCICKICTEKEVGTPILKNNW
jgi:hypothetical protein